MKVKKGRE